MSIESVIRQAFEVRAELNSKNNFAENLIEMSLNPVPPFRGTGEIKLIIIGQDPTIRNLASRKKITSTLNLDKNGSLKNYVNQICDGLEMNLANVYATNIFKYFYTIPPQQTLHVLHSHLERNLELLKTELKSFPDIPVITLGLPVLQLLAGKQHQVSYYWDYNKKIKITNGNFKFCKSFENTLALDFFPFFHVPSLRNKFYRNTLPAYLNFVNNTINQF